MQYACHGVTSEVTWPLLWFGFRDENQIVQKYFWEGFSYVCITKLLHEYHGLIISIRTLRRRLQDMGLARRQQCPSLLSVDSVEHHTHGALGARLFGCLLL